MKLSIIPMMLFCATICAQDGFIQLLDQGPIEKNEVYDIHFDSVSNSLIVLGREIDTFFSAMKLIKLDTNGLILKESIFEGDSTFSFSLNSNNNISNIGVNKFQVFGDLFNSDLKHFIYHFNNNLDSLTYLINDEPDGTISRVSSRSYKFLNNIYLTSTKSQGFKNFIDMEKLDLDMEVVDNFNYKKGNLDEEFISHIEHLDNGEFLVSGLTFKGVPFETKLLFVRIDSSLNLLNERNGISNDGDGTVSQIVHFKNNLNEDRLAFGNSFNVTENGEFLSTIRYFITDLDGNLIDSTWLDNERSLHNYYLYNQRVKDGFITAGTIKVEGISKINPFVAKYDEEADTVWTSSIFMTDSIIADFSVITGMQVLPSGSILLCGNYEIGPSGKTTPFLIKLDKDGCLVPGCRPVSSVSDVKEKGIPLIYPNPIKDKITVELENAGSISLTDIGGKMIGNFKLQAGPNVIEASSFPKGVILYSLLNNGQNFSGKLIKM